MIYIKDIATYIPEEYSDNYLTAKKFDETNQFVDTKIGAQRLPFKNGNEECSDLAVKAINKLVEKNNVNLDSIDAIVLVTQNGDHNGLPHTSAIVQSKLNLKNEISCFDISLGCSGYVYGLSILKSHMIEMGFDNAILVTSDPYSKIINKNDRVTSLLFGDAATATLLSVTGCLNIHKPSLYTDGSGSLSLFKNKNRLLEMNGRDVFNFAAKNVPVSVTNYLDKSLLKKEDVDLFLFHQGSAAIIDVITRRLSLNKELVPFDIKNTGNTVSSSIPILLEKYINNINKNRILISGFGVGLSWATMLLTRVKND